MAAIFQNNDFGSLSKWFWAHAVIIVLGISLVKISIGFFLLRFAAQKKPLKLFIIGSLGSVAGRSSHQHGLTSSSIPVSIHDRLHADLDPAMHPRRSGLGFGCQGTKRDKMLLGRDLPEDWQIQQRYVRMLCS
jgi:hypothetical protein